MKEALLLLNEMVHQLQKERGCVSLFLGSEGKRFHDETHQQFLKTDKAANILRSKYKDWHTSDIRQTPLSNKLGNYLEQIEQLHHQRELISATNQSTYEAINFYTYSAIAPLLDIIIETALYDKNNDSTKVSTYANFLQLKERTGRERAIGMRGFLSTTFQDQEFVERLRFLISEQESYQRTFLALANEEQSKCFTENMRPTCTARVEKIHQELRKAPETKLLNVITAEAWYELMTRKIDMMQQTVLMLTDTIRHSNATSTQTKNTDKEYFPLANTLNNQHKKFISTLPFFSGLSDSVLSSLLQSAQTRKYKKGKLLFIEGEQATRLYFIIDGWVKLFKGTAAGEETIIQMLSCGDMVGESAVFLNTTFPVNAQIAENATLLTFPAPVIREWIRNCNELAINMLASMSRGSQTLIYQMESTRLKSVNERTGWFLLKLLLEKNWDSNAIELPYDKSIIASYLNMKPETFSRTLKLFKEQGFRIKNDTIILPNAISLCMYCDIDTETLCSRHGTSDCPNPQQKIQHNQL